jgi:hypothetical protein
VSTDTVSKASKLFYGLPFDLASGWYNCFSDEYFLVFSVAPIIITESILVTLKDGEEVLLAECTTKHLSFLQVFDDNGEPKIVKNTKGMLRLPENIECYFPDPVYPKNAEF